MEPRPGEPGLIGFVIPIIDGPGFIEISARTGSDYGLDTSASGFQHLLPADSINVRLWGTPASKTNDPLRFPFGWGQETSDICANLPEPNAPCNGSEPVPSDAPTIPFLQNPTTCGVPLTASVDVLSYDGETTHAEVPWPPTTGCEQLAFNPALTAQPTTTQADTPTGLDVNLRAPQTLSEKVPSASELKSTVVTLPEGFSINPNAADGKTSCSDAQAKFGTTLEAECPEISKIGTIEIDSSALPAELPGAIYIGEPQPGNKYRIFITGDGFGTHIKLPGSIQLDPQTGRMVVSFKNLPQTPLEGFNFHFFGSDRGLLATPTHCGSYRSQSRLRTVGQRALESVLAELVHDRLRTERHPLSGCGPAVQPDDDRRQLRQHRRRLLEPAAAGQSHRRGPEHGPYQHRDAPRLLGQDRRHPLLPRVGDPGAPVGRLLGHHRDDEPRLPGREPGRHDVLRDRSRNPPVELAGEDLPRGAVQRRAALADVRRPGGIGAV